MQNPSDSSGLVSFSLLLSEEEARIIIEALALRRQESAKSADRMELQAKTEFERKLVARCRERETLAAVTAVKVNAALTAAYVKPING